MAEHGNFANAEEGQNGQKWLIIGVNFEISKTCGKKLQKQFRVAVCKKLNRLQYPHNFEKMISLFTKVIVSKMVQHGLYFGADLQNTKKHSKNY